MPIETRWYDDEQTIIHVEFSSPWVWNDLYKLDDVLERFINGVTHPVSFLVSFERMHSFPGNLTLEPVRHVLRFNNPNSQVIVVYGLRRVTRMLARTVLSALDPRTLNSTVIIAESLEDALIKIATFTPVNAPQVRGE